LVERREDCEHERHRNEEHDLLRATSSLTWPTASSRRISSI
jgi:hypothetical protein